MTSDAAAKISLEEIHAHIQRILSTLRNRGVEFIYYKKDAYWYISVDESENYNEDVSPVLGSREEDVEYLSFEFGENEYVSYKYIQAISSIIQNIAINEHTKGKLVP